MKTANYIDILNQSADWVDVDRATIFTSDWKKFRTFHNRRLRRAWDQWFWTELTKTEQRFYRQDWAVGTAYSAGDEVYYPVSGAYYQALQASTGEAPADGNETTNLTYWSKALTEFSASAFSTSTVHVQADKVTYNGATYQMHTASGVAGTLPSDTTYWGVITPFSQYVALNQSWQTNEMGDIESVHDRDPRVSTKSTEVIYALTENGVQVLEPRTFVWVTFKDPFIELKGDVFDATATYAVDDQIYYSSTTTPGNFYVCTVVTTAGQDPDDTAASWSKVSIPLIFSDYLQLGAAADWERSLRNLEMMGFYSTSAKSELDARQSTETSAQGQLPRTRVLRGQHSGS